MPDNSSSRRRGTASNWMPLIVTFTVATVGVAAWAWSQRNRDDEYEDDEGEQTGTGFGSRPGSRPRPGLPSQPYSDVEYGVNPVYGAATTTQSPPPQARGGDNTITMTDATSAVGSTSGWSARIGALGGSSSPQEWVGNASKAVTAGITAASAAVGGALASIREGDKDAYADHETWSQETDMRRRASGAVSSSTGPPPATMTSASTHRKRKTVVIVISADHYVDVDEDGFHEHAVSFLFFFYYSSFYPLLFVF